MSVETYLFPASYAQQSLWVVEQLAQGKPIYNFIVPMYFNGHLQKTALEYAIREIVKRHEILHTTFRVLNGKLMQVVKSNLDTSAQLIPFPHYIDLVDLPSSEREDEALKCSLAECLLPFDLENGPLLRTIVVQLHEKKHLVCFCLHHIIFDRWSIAVLIREMAVFYNASVYGVPASVAPLPIQYADFAVWERTRLSEERLEVQLAYWRKQLANVPVDLKLPIDRPRSATRSFQGKTRYFQIPNPLAQQMKEIGLQENATFFMTLLAVFQILLYRYSGQEDIVVGTPIAGRVNPAVNDLIGLFFNTLVLRIDLSGGLTFRTFLSNVRAMVLDAYTHQDIPFDKLVEILQPGRELNRHPLFQVVFIFQNNPLDTDEAVDTVQLADLSVELFDLPPGGAVFDLLLSFAEGANGLSGMVNYNVDLFDEETITRLIGHYEQLLTAIVANADAQIDRLMLLTPQEYQQIVLDWNATHQPFADTLCIHELIEAHVARNPQGLAIVCNDQQMTYDQLNRQANRIAHQLIALGIGPGSYVAVMLKRSILMIPVLLGIIKSGAAYVSLELSWPPSRWNLILSRLRVPCVITEQGLLPHLQEIEPFSFLRHVLCLDGDEVPFEAQYRSLWTRTDLEQQDEENIPGRVCALDTAYVIFTSGSTGTPKTVLGLHRPVVNFIDSVRRTFHIGPQDRGLFLSTLSFDLSIFDIFALLACGGSVQVATQEELQDPRCLLALLLEQHVTIWDSVPSALQQLIPFSLQADAASKLYLRLAFLGGDWIPLDLPDQVRASFPNVEVIAMGGTTETTVWSNFFRVRQIEASWKSIPYGHPVQNAQYYILNRSLQPMPIGVPGDLYIGGSCLCGGYLEAEITAAKFLPDPFGMEAGGRIYSTGDLACWRADGTIEFLGRVDHQVKIRGFRLEPGEIETAVLQHEAVQQAVVIAQEVSRGDKRLIAYVTLRPEFKEKETQENSDIPQPAKFHHSITSLLRRKLQAQLPDYMVPSEFIVVEQMPLAQTGKIDRAQLSAWRESYKASVQEVEEYTKPRTSIEEALLKIWIEVLAREPISIYNNFFELGGHSLLATQIITRIQNTFEVDLSLRHIFVTPTIADMSEVIEDLLLARVEALSEEEAQSLVGEQ